MAHDRHKRNICRRKKEDRKDGGKQEEGRRKGRLLPGMGSSFPRLEDTEEFGLKRDAVILKAAAGPFLWVSGSPLLHGGGTVCLPASHPALPAGPSASVQC